MNKIKHKNSALMDAHVNSYRQADWRIGESVWDWIIRKTGISGTKSSIKALADDRNTGEATLHRLKKTKQHSFSRDSLGVKLAEKKAGDSDPDKDLRKKKDHDYQLGRYGYVPGQVFEEETSLGISEEQLAINTMIQKDFQKLIDTLTLQEAVCQFCKPSNIDLVPHKDVVVKECLSIFLSTHKNHQYGAIYDKKGKGFELNFKICKHCFKEIEKSNIFLLPLSAFISKVMKKHELTPQKLAEQIGTTQSNISRLINNKKSFVPPELLAKLYGLYKLGPDTEHKKEHARLLLFAADIVAGKIDEKEFMAEICPEEKEKKEDFLKNIRFHFGEEIVDYLGLYGEGRLSVDNITLDDIYIDSNEISLICELEASFESDSGYPYFENTSTSSPSEKFRLILVDIERRIKPDGIEWDYNPKDEDNTYLMH